MGRDKLLAYIAALILILAICFAGWDETYAEGQKVFVLCYHSFLGNKRFAGDVSLQELRFQMDFFKSKGFHFIMFSDLLNGTVTGTQNILIVIDDGNQSVYQAYRQVFQPRHIKPMLAIYPGIIGKKSYTLTWDQLKELSQDGCEIAAHGYYHLLLNQQLYDKDRKDFIKEIYTSKETLEKRLNVRISDFAYPDGVYSDITEKTLKDAGYTYAFTIKWGPLLYPLRLNADQYKLPRYMIYKDNWGMISNSIIKAAAN